jgi:hypothetical protein
LDVIPDNGAAIKHAFQRAQRLTQQHPGLFKDVGPQWDSAQLACESPWGLSKRGQKLVRSAEGLLKLVCPTFFAAYQSAKKALTVGP